MLRGVQEVASGSHGSGSHSMKTLCPGQRRHFLAVKGSKHHRKENLPNLP